MSVKMELVWEIEVLQMNTWAEYFITSASLCYKAKASESSSPLYYLLMKFHHHVGIRRSWQVSVCVCESTFSNIILFSLWPGSSSNVFELKMLELRNHKWLLLGIDGWSVCQELYVLQVNQRKNNVSCSWLCQLDEGNARKRIENMHWPPSFSKSHSAS